MTQRYFFLLLLLLGSQLVFAQINEQYHKVRVRLEGRDIQELARLGLETDHGEYVPHRHLTNDFSDSELRRIIEAGFDYEVLIPDVVDFYSNPARRNEYLSASRGGGTSCPEDGEGEGSVFDYPVPTNFRLGEMAGFYTYQEMLNILDSMRLLFPHLITSRRIVSPSIVSHQGRPIYWMKISDNPDTDEAAEPEVLYTALHHAREPNSLTQMVFYMWYLLENYETDPEVRFIVDNTALYFMPCLNPDGYIFNETSNPDGGGLWRKNRRDNGDGSTGVDLNRNYGYQWGFDNSGSSPNPESQTYRGTAGFSEPETQAVRALCLEREFVVALNYHAYGNLLIYPWGFSDTPTDDAPTFNTLGKIMKMQNDYLVGTGTETVGYTVNGDSDDWFYGETAEKPVIFAMTPEVGRGGEEGGFWPIESDIIPNCQASLWMNMVAAETPHISGVAIADPTQVEIAMEDPYFRFEVQRFGMTDGTLTVSLNSLQEDLIQVAEEPMNYNLDENMLTLDSFALSQTGAIAPGTSLRFLLEINNGSFTRTDTVSRIFGGFLDTDVFNEAFPELDQWTAEEGWELTEEDFVSGPHSLTDSPYENYPNNRFALITLDEAISVGEAQEYRLEFWAKWEIEEFYDWAQLQFQVNDGEWIPACGRYTVSGSALQAPGQPIWQGQQSDWIEEAIDLTPYLTAGDEIRLRFIMLSDEFVNPDGFYVDNIVLQERNSEPVSTDTPIANSDFSVELRPNPSRGTTQLHFRLPASESGVGHWRLYQADGQAARSGQQYMSGGYGEVSLDLTNLPAGVYWLQAEINDQQLATKRLVLIK